MGLFVKKIVEDNRPAYTLSLGKTLLIVGLGNPGKDYVGTRHNIGFAAVDAFMTAHDFPKAVTKKDLKCSLSSLQMGDNRVLCIKPLTYMNISGEAVQAVMNFYKVTAENVLVIHDELDIPFGDIRCKVGGSSAGHNGVSSVAKHIGENFGRVRVGIRTDIAEKADAADFVLGTFTSEEASKLPSITTEATSILTEWVFGGQKLPRENRSVL